MEIKTTSKTLLEKNTAGIIIKPSSPQLKDTYFRVKELFEKYKIKCFLEDSSAIMIEEKSKYSFEDLCKNTDFLVSLGGDGTLLSVVRKSFSFNKAVLGINLGTLGFLTDIQVPKLEEFLKEFVNDEFIINERMMIEGQIGFNEIFAFNDIVISRQSISSMVKVDAKINGKYFNSYYGDGLIIATPTGSTAYNLSVGGPIIYPLSKAFVLTPLAAHSLTQRPIVLPNDFELEFNICDNQGAVAIIDGQDIYEIKQNESIKIKSSLKNAKLIHSKKRDYFEVLNEKLNWGN